MAGLHLSSHRMTSGDLGRSTTGDEIESLRTSCPDVKPPATQAKATSWTMMSVCCSRQFVNHHPLRYMYKTQTILSRGAYFSAHKKDVESSLDILLRHLDRKDVLLRVVAISEKPSLHQPPRDMEAPRPYMTSTTEQALRTSGLCDGV